MHDWNALWHTHQGYRSGYGKPHQDINDLGAELNATCLHPAADHHDVAVYQADDQYILVGHDNGLQILTLNRQALFNIAIRFVAKDEGQGVTPPYIEVLVSNSATEEQEAWRGAIRRDEQGRIWLEKHQLSEGVMPAMNFDTLSFTDHARFRDILYSRWQAALPGMQPEIENWVPNAELEQVRRARYQALIKHEQAVLERMFSQEERQLIARALYQQKFDDAASCRGLWLKLETSPVPSDSPVDIEQLLSKMQKLSYAQEMAIIEAL